MKSVGISPIKVSVNKKVKVNPRSSFFFKLYWFHVPIAAYQSLGPLDVAPEKKIFKGFTIIWALWPSWSSDPDVAYKLLFPGPWRLSIKSGFDWPSGFRGNV